MHLSAARDCAWEGGAFGYGLDTTIEVSKRFRSPLGETIGSTVHNVPLIVWLETGWVGLLCLGWLWSTVIALFAAGLRHEDTSPSARRHIASYAALLTLYGIVSLVCGYLERVHWNV